MEGEEESENETVKGVGKGNRHINEVLGRVRERGKDAFLKRGKYFH